MVSLLDQLDTLAQALDSASGEADYADDIARKTHPGLRSDIQDVDRELRRLYRRVEKLQLRADRIASIEADDFDDGNPCWYEDEDGEMVYGVPPCAQSQARGEGLLIGV